MNSDTLILENLELARHLAKAAYRRFANLSSLEDFVQWGYLGLVKAARRYDPERGTPFDAFARLYIQGAIMETVRRRNLKIAKYQPLDRVVAIADRLEEAGFWSDRFDADSRPNPEQAAMSARGEVNRRLDRAKLPEQCVSIVDAYLEDKSLARIAKEQKRPEWKVIQDWGFLRQTLKAA